RPVTGLVRVAFHRNDKALVGLQGVRELIEVFLGGRAQRKLVERERNAGGSLHFVVVDIGNNRPQLVQVLTVGIGHIASLLGLIHGIGSVRIGYAGMLISGSSVLIRGRRPFLRRVNAALGLVIDTLQLALRIFDLLTVLGCLRAHLVHFGLDGSGGVAHVFLRRTAAHEQRAR